MRFSLGDSEGCRTGDSGGKFVAAECFVLPMPVIQAVVVTQKIGILRSARRVRLNIVAVGDGEAPRLVLVDVATGDRLPFLRKALHDLKIKCCETRSICGIVG